MKIAVACDHGGLRLKNVLIEEMKKQGYEVVDFGTYNEESCDYPDYASKAAKAVALGECEKGVVVCGTGIGVHLRRNRGRGSIPLQGCEIFSSRRATERFDRPGIHHVCQGKGAKGIFLAVGNDGDPSLSGGFRPGKGGIDRGRL